MEEITLEARISNVAAVTDFINVQLEQVNCSLRAQMQLDIAIDEIFSNISQYAYPGETGNATVRFEQTDPCTVSLTFIDEGIPFNPLEVEEPDTTLNAEKRPIGGLGILLLRKTMDGLSYRYDNGKNVFRVEKRIC